MARLEYKYGQVYWVDLKPGDLIPISGGNFITLTINDIDEIGMLKNNYTISNEVANCLIKNGEDK